MRGLSRRTALGLAGAGLLAGRARADTAALPFGNGERPIVQYPQKRPLLRLTTRPPGYRLDVAPELVDAARFERLAAAADRAAARNPAGTGQPGAECGDPGATVEPAGFGTGGFATAETHYAGTDGTPSLANGNAHAVSQYDVACYQVTQSH